MQGSITAHLRRLKTEDAPRMLEWMQDESVVKHLYADFRHKTLQDCQRFIQASQQSGADLHLAITTSEDNYLGTVSLKHIDEQSGIAEFGICMHPEGMGKGLSKDAMAQILAYGHRTLGLRAVYWCVSAQNSRANRFYQKNNYQLTNAVPNDIQKRYPDFGMGELIWYCSKQEETATK